MRKSGYISSFCAVVLTLTAVMVSCSTEECYDNKNALPYAGLYGVADGKEISIQVDSLEVYGAGVPADSILSDGKTSIKSIYLPFRIDSDTTRYVFRYLAKDLASYDLRDTVTFIYSREARFVSSACGVSYVFEISKIDNTGLLIDSVVCPGMRITNANVENLKIFFRISEEGMGNE